LAAVNWVEEKMLIGSIGMLTRISTSTKTASSSTPPANVISTTGEVQPRSGAAISP
jgi:hypothetical protein